jgi:hypothetical protein
VVFVAGATTGAAGVGVIAGVGGAAGVEPVGIWLTKPESGVAVFSNALLPVRKAGIEAAVKSPLAIKASRITVLAY